MKKNIKNCNYEALPVAISIGNQKKIKGIGTTVNEQTNTMLMFELLYINLLQLVVVKQIIQRLTRPCFI